MEWNIDWIDVDYSTYRPILKLKKTLPDTRKVSFNVSDLLHEKERNLVSFSEMLVSASP